jgi:hypothetical protein
LFVAVRKFIGFTALRTKREKIFHEPELQKLFHVWNSKWEIYYTHKRGKVTHYVKYFI